MVGDELEGWRLAGFSLLHLCVEGAAFESRLTPGMSLLMSGLPYADLNMAIVWGSAGGGGAGGGAGGDIAWVCERSESLRAPCLILTPGGESGAGRDCEGAGLVGVGEIPLMRLVGGGAVVGETGGACGLVECDGEVMSANEVTGAAFGLPVEAVGRVFGERVPSQPGLRVYVARHEGRVVSGLRISRIGEVAMIWCMATAVDQLRRGFGRRLLAAAISAERAAGAAEFLLLATPAGQPLYRSVGFEVISVASAWLQGGSFAVGGGAGEAHG